MNGNSRMAMVAGAAIVVVLVAGGLMFFGGSRPPVGAPTPSSQPTSSLNATQAPSASPRPSSALGLEIKGPASTLTARSCSASTTRPRTRTPSTPSLPMARASCCCRPTPAAPRSRPTVARQPSRSRPMAEWCRRSPASASPVRKRVLVRLRAWAEPRPRGLVSNFNNLAFEGWADGDPSKTGIYLSLSNGGRLLRGDLVQLASIPGQQADIPIAFSPDGSKLLFIRETPNAERTGDLYVIGIHGSGLRRLNPPDVGVATSDLFGPGASWSPDGTQVAFSAFDRAGDGYADTSRAYVVDVAGGEATPITEDSTYMTSAHWSPDGRMNSSSSTIQAPRTAATSGSSGPMAPMPTRSPSRSARAVPLGRQIRRCWSSRAPTPMAPVCSSLTPTRRL